MKNIRGTIFLILMVSMGLVAQEIPYTKEMRSAELVAAWTIDLRPTPSAPDYYQSFTVAEVSGNTFTGTFYGSAIENGYLNANWARLYFAFTTQDQNNAYYHSGYLENGQLYGISYCPGRNFTAPWFGTKKME
ncbi:MAG: hypothetical protein HKN52_10160 [Eudoraea sp.]|nr:hypothetical protein [Eudoraea sp.]